MSEGSWPKPPYAARLVICGVVATMHAALLMSYRSQHPAVPGTALEGNPTVFLVQSRATPPAVKRESINKPSPTVAKRKPRATTLSDQRSAPGDNAASDNVAEADDTSALGKTAEVDPNWAEGRSVKPAPVTDIKAYSLSLAGKADVEARQGKPVPLVDTPFKRMQRNMAQAARGGGNSTTTAISSSGEAITVVTRGGKMRCYVPVSTSVAPSAVFENRGSGRSTEVQCPKELR